MSVPGTLDSEEYHILLEHHFRSSQSSSVRRLILFFCRRGIEWCGVSYIISWSQMDAGGSKVKNEIFVTDVTSGNFQAIRTNAGAESPIELIRVSPLR
jgi:hypothetical protein